MHQKRKAVALISGGLDSLLAAQVILAQGIHVEGINFYTGFCIEGHTHAIRHQNSRHPKRNRALQVAEQLGIRLHFIDISAPYKDIVLNPRHGYGSNLNPCIDCKCFMVRQAVAWMHEHNFDFIITGEVIGQRPMSQRKNTLPIIANESGADDLLLRPLCAKKLPLTLPEREGWVDRDRLHDFNGRSRKSQMALAASYNFQDYAQPAGGCCFLTDSSYSAKFVDLWKFRGSRDYDLDDIFLLKIGRHLRPRPYFKLIVGREEGENNFLAGYRKRFIHLQVLSHYGPMVLVDGTPQKFLDRELIARIAARFSQGKNSEFVEVELTELDGSSIRIIVTPFKPEEVLESWYIGISNH
ncbi:tRNA U34 2-thiouridine synthase MnmA/TrmU [Gammaproteobacteria bacterium]